MSVHAHTPNLIGTDPRGLPVRAVGYWREGSERPQARISRQAFDHLGRGWRAQDARFGEADLAQYNLVDVHALSGSVLARDSVDAGWHLQLAGEAGQPLVEWNGRAVKYIDYDEILRPAARREQPVGGAQRVAGRFEYGVAGAAEALMNQCGRVVRVDDDVGSEAFEYGFAGQLVEQSRRFLAADALPDWPAALGARDALLETQASATRQWSAPSGELLRQRDAAGNESYSHYDQAGQLQRTSVRLAGAELRPVVEGLAYDAAGRLHEEALANGVDVQRTFSAEEGRLLRLQARRRNGGALLQDLGYEYGPAGHILAIHDHRQPVRHFANQRIEPVRRFQYDSTYQLIDATGWETSAPGQVANYSEHYRYDAGGNLLELQHRGATQFTRSLQVAEDSNRSLPLGDDHRNLSTRDFAEAFDARGNLRSLWAGTLLQWDLSDRLQGIDAIRRDDAANDAEWYRYDGAGQRRRKCQQQLALVGIHRREVRYLPGLEERSNTAIGERLQVVALGAGSTSVRVLHWLEGRPEGVANDQLRFCLGDHLGSCSLELDADAGVISEEAYHPHGSTAWSAARNEVEASYRTVRYSGKERDASGLYDYGFRYYAPWLMRWINPDPAWEVDGLNFYRAMRNDPVNHVDDDGRMPNDPLVKVAEGVMRLSSYRPIYVKRLVGNLISDFVFEGSPLSGLEEAAVSNFLTKWLPTDVSMVTWESRALFAAVHESATQVRSVGDTVVMAGERGKLAEAIERWDVDAWNTSRQKTIEMGVKVHRLRRNAVVKLPQATAEAVPSPATQFDVEAQTRVAGKAVAGITADVEPAPPAPPKPEAVPRAVQHSERLTNQLAALAPGNLKKVENVLTDLDSGSNRHSVEPVGLGRVWAKDLTFADGGSKGRGDFRLIYKLEVIDRDAGVFGYNVLGIGSYHNERNIVTWRKNKC
jgi:insecticidal toxin complex protein TccC